MSSVLASPLVEAVAGDDCLPAGVEAAAPENGRVLLLDDDPAFRDIIRDCLAENGYTVVAVQNGGEGVREVLGGDFALVVCDISMPGLPGDMFYRAVERIRPDLCQRFIFVTGHGHDAATSGFIRGINAFVLQKPFPLKKLMDAIALADVRRTYQSVIDSKPDAGAPPRMDWPRCDLPARAPVLREEPVLEQKVARIVARAQIIPTSVPKSEDFSFPEPEVPARGGSRSFVFAAVAVVLVVTAGLWNRYYAARDRAAVASMDRLAAKAEWSAVAPRVQEAAVALSEMEKVKVHSALLVAERAKPRWTPLLRCLVPPGDARISILGVAVVGGVEDLGACELRVRGVAIGREPQVVAQRFRMAVDEGLKRSANGRPVRTRFEGLKDEPGTTPEENRAAFVMIANVGVIQPAVAVRKGGR